MKLVVSASTYKCPTVRTILLSVALFLVWGQWSMQKTSVEKDLFVKDLLSNCTMYVRLESWRSAILSMLPTGDYIGIACLVYTQMPGVAESQYGSC